MNPSSLYEQDFYLWLEQTAQHLQQGRLEQINWEHLIEEITALGRSEKNEVKSRLRVLLAHLLKRCYVDLPDCDRGWQDTITEQRSELDVRLDTSPSLRRYMQEILPECWRYAHEQVATDYPLVNFPTDNPFGEDIDQLLRYRYWIVK